MRASRLRNYGQSVNGEHAELGLNSRLDEIQAAMLSERLKWVPVFNERRRQIAETYRAEIRNPFVRLLSEPEETAAHVYHLFVVLCDRRSDLQKHLQEHGVQTLIHYPFPVHLQKSCRNLMRDPHGLPNSEHHALHAYRCRVIRRCRITM